MNVYVTTSLQNVIWYTITFNMVMYRLYMLHLPPPVNIRHHGDTVQLCISESNRRGAHGSCAASPRGYCSLSNQAHPPDTGHETV